MYKSLFLWYFWLIFFLCISYPCFLVHFQIQTFDLICFNLLHWTASFSIQDTHLSIYRYLFANANAVMDVTQHNKQSNKQSSWSAGMPRKCDICYRPRSQKHICSKDKNTYQSASKSLDVVLYYYSKNHCLNLKHVNVKIFGASPIWYWHLFHILSCVPSTETHHQACHWSMRGRAILLYFSPQFLMFIPHVFMAICILMYLYFSNN